MRRVFCRLLGIHSAQRNVVEAPYIIHSNIEMIYIPEFTGALDDLVLQDRFGWMDAAYSSAALFIQRSFGED